MSTSQNTPFLISLMHATKAALQSAQKEFFLELNPKAHNSVPVKVIPKTRTNSVSTTNMPQPYISSEKLTYLRSVYLKPPLHNR